MNFQNILIKKAQANINVYYRQNLSWNVSNFIVEEYMFWKLLTYVWKLISIHELSKYFDKERWSKYESVLQTTIWESDDEQRWKYTLTYRGHERVKNTDSKGSATCKWLSEIEFSVRIIIIILIKKLNIAVIDQLCDHWNIGSIHWTFPVQHNGRSQARLIGTF